MPDSHNISSIKRISHIFVGPVKQIREETAKLRERLEQLESSITRIERATSDADVSKDESNKETRSDG